MWRAPERRVETTQYAGDRGREAVTVGSDGPVRDYPYRMTPGNKASAEAMP